MERMSSNSERAADSVQFTAQDSSIEVLDYLFAHVYRQSEFQTGLHETFHYRVAFTRFR